MPIGDQQTRSRRYSASVAQVSSIDDPTNSTTSSAPGAPISIRIRRRPRSLHTRIVTTHVEGSATSQDTARSRSPKRLSGVPRRVPRDDAVATGSSLRLINGFDVTVDGCAVPLATNAQRLLAFLALRERPQPRSAVAGTLWIDRTDRRAAANLRTALWKLGTHGHRLIAMRGNLLALADDVVVDFRVVIGQARALLQRTGRPPPGGEQALSVDVFAGDLLPDWDEDWILFERERLRQLRMHAIEALSRLLVGAGRYAEAVDAGLAAVAADVLRESAHRVLIEAYLGEGNVADARRQFDHFKAVLWDSLGLRPSGELAGLVGA